MAKNKILCIHHGVDLDGYCSAGIVNYKFSGESDITFVPFDYGMTFDPSQYDLPNTDVIMCDISMPLDVMLKLEKESKSFVYIDHHAKTVNELTKHLNKNNYYCSQGTPSACELVYKYYFDTNKIPEGIKLLSDYDSWNDSDIEYFEEQCVPFNYGMRGIAESWKTDGEVWRLIIEEDKYFCRGVILDGGIIEEYTDIQNEQLSTKESFEVDIPMGDKKIKAIAMNTNQRGSTNFYYVYDNTMHDVMLAFCYTGKEWRFSIYSDKDNVDCAAIAKEIGGGSGHRGASGGKFKTLPEWLINNK